MISFKITLESGKNFTFEIEKANRMHSAKKINKPVSWTQLEYHQCVNCPLTINNTPYCPTALDLVNIVEPFLYISSIEPVTITIKEIDFEYTRKTDAQHALFNVFFYIIYTSSCPHQQLLRPLVKYIDPFPDLETMTYHLLAMHLVRDYFDQPECATFRIEELKKNLEQLELTLDGLLDRIRNIISGDATINSVVIMITTWALIIKSIDKNLELVKKNFNIL